MALRSVRIENTGKNEVSLPFPLVGVLTPGAGVTVNIDPVTKGYTDSAANSEQAIKDLFPNTGLNDLLWQRLRIASMPLPVATETSGVWASAEDLEDVKHEVYNDTGAPIVAGSLVYQNGYNVANNCPMIALADRDSPVSRAQWVVQSDIATGTVGYVVDELVVSGVETAALAATNPIFLDSVAGGWALTDAAGANVEGQVVGYVRVQAASPNGVVVLCPKKAPFVIGTDGLRDSVLSASAGGRAKMENGFFNTEATFDDKTAAGIIGDDRMVSSIVKAIGRTSVGYAYFPGIVMPGGGLLVDVGNGTDTLNHATTPGNTAALEAAALAAAINGFAWTAGIEIDAEVIGPAATPTVAIILRQATPGALALTLARAGGLAGAVEVNVPVAGAAAAVRTMSTFVYDVTVPDVAALALNPGVSQIIVASWPQIVVPLVGQVLLLRGALGARVITDADGLTFAMEQIGIAAGVNYWGLIVSDPLGILVNGDTLHIQMVL